MEVDYDEFIREVIREFKPTEDYIYNRQVLNALYETKFGICNHYEENSPLASSKINPSEKFIGGFLYESHLRTFLYRDVSKKLGMSFDEYLGKPRYEIDLINKVIEEVDALKAKTNETMLAQLASNKDQNKPKQ